MNHAKNIQLAFMTKVKSAIPAHVSFVDELADLLKTSNDSAYRRIRGETLLSIDEVTAICSYFKVSLETASQPDSETVTFNYRILKGGSEGFRNWLAILLDNVKRISASGGSVMYAADDVPVWHHFFRDDFASFKVFYWMKSILNAPELENKPFDMDLIDPELVTKAKELLQEYNQLKSTEIWTEDTLNSTLKQIEYYWESGFFKDKGTALLMCDCVEEEVNTLRRNAERCSKLPGENGSTVENFSFYQSEIMVGNNSILANVGDTKIAYVSNNTFNFMTTMDRSFVNENETWLKNLLRKSILISGVNEKQRNKFFTVLKHKIDGLRATIK